MAQPVRFVFLSVIIGIFIFGVYDYTNNFESNNCVMTYMYQRPEYLVSIVHKPKFEAFSQRTLKYRLPLVFGRVDRF